MLHVSRCTFVLLLHNKKKAPTSSAGAPWKLSWIAVSVVGLTVSGLLQVQLQTECSRTKYSGTKNQPKEEVFGTDIPRTSGGHSRGYPDPKLRSGRPRSWKNKHLGADIHDPKARTSTTLRDLQKLRSEKLWAEFSSPKYWQIIKVTVTDSLSGSLSCDWRYYSCDWPLLLGIV